MDQDTSEQSTGRRPDITPAHSLAEGGSTAAGGASRRRATATENTPEALPAFKYHPDPIASDSIVESERTCAACSRARGYELSAAPYGPFDGDPMVCPWCIADGTAAAVLDATFNNTAYDAPADIPAAVIDEIERRTPGFCGWQEERWLFHCGDGAAYLGPTGFKELSYLPDALEDLRRRHERGNGPSPEETAVDGNATAYLFRCLTCNTHLAYGDFN